MNCENKTTTNRTDLGNIPKDWNVEILDNYLDWVTYGFTCPMPTSIQGPYMITAKDLEGNRINYDGARKTTNAAFDERLTNKSRPNRNDILLSKDGTLGRVALVGDEQLCINQSVALLRANKRILPRFLYYLLLTPYYQRRMDMDSDGSVLKHIYITRVNLMEVAVPKICEQQGIVNVLSSFDSKIELNQQMNRAFEAIGQALFKQWFVDFDFPNEEGKPYKSSGGEMVYNEDIEKKIPKTWTVRTLDKISVNSDSKRVPLSSREREKMKGIYPYYGAVGIVDHINQFLFDGSFLLMSEDGAYVVDKNGFPMLQLVRGKFWVNNHAHILQGKGISTELLFLLLKNTNVQHIVTGAAQPKINQGNMNTLKFVIPDEDCKSKLQEFVSQLYGKMSINIEQNQTLSEIRDLLLPRLISGKIRVPNCKWNLETK